MDDEVAELGLRVHPGQRISWGRRRCTVPEPRQQLPRVIIYNKPEGEVCTRDDPEGRPTVYQSLPPLRGARWIGVGRLDANTQGLMIFTDDGELANRLMHPSSEVLREYAVRVLGQVEPAALQQLTRGLRLEDGPAAFERVERKGGSGANVWYHCWLREGRKREVRRLWEAIGCQISRLIRVAYGPVTLPEDLPRGRTRRLRVDAVRELLDSVPSRGVTPPA